MSENRFDAASIGFGDDTEIEDVDLNTEEVYVNGRRLTESEVNAAAEELERKNRADNLIPGGKSLSGDGSHSPVLQARGVSAGVRARFEVIAERRGVRPSRLLREAIDRRSTGVLRVKRALGSCAISCASSSVAAGSESTAAVDACSPSMSMLSVQPSPD